MTDRGQDVNETGLWPDYPDQKQTLEDRAYEALMAWLVHGQVKLGEPVPLRAFAQKLGMSRTPVRTALGRLHEQGLIDYNAKLGFTVATPTTTDLYEIFDLRMMFELHALRSFFNTSQEASFAGLRQLATGALSLARVVVKDPSKLTEFWGLDLRFHRSIVALAGNSRMVAWFDRLQGNSRVLQLGRLVPLTLERFQVTALEHMAIVEALEDGYRDLAIQRLQDHLTRVCDQTVGWSRSAGAPSMATEPKWLRPQRENEQIRTHSRTER